MFLNKLNKWDFCNFVTTHPLFYWGELLKFSSFSWFHFLIFDKFLGTKNTPEGVLIIDVLFT